jgi:hypothetical protein
VRETNITYEDLAMRFLYWPDAKVTGDATILLTSTWVVDIIPPPGTVTQYSKVRAYFSKQDKALFKMKGLDANEKVVREFTARGGMKSDGYWYLKTMQITKENKNTYLELEDVVKN